MQIAELVTYYVHVALPIPRAKAYKKVELLKQCLAQHGKKFLPLYGSEPEEEQIAQFRVCDVAFRHAWRTNKWRRHLVITHDLEPLRDLEHSFELLQQLTGQAMRRINHVTKELGTPLGLTLSHGARLHCEPLHSDTPNHPDLHY